MNWHLSACLVFVMAVFAFLLHINAIAYGANLRKVVLRSFTSDDWVCVYLEEQPARRDGRLLSCSAAANVKAYILQNESEPLVAVGAGRNRKP